MKTQKTLTVTTEAKDPYLMSFAYLPASKTSVNQVLVPLEVLSQSSEYGEFWMGGGQVSIDQTEKVTKIITPDYLVLVYDSTDQSIAQMVEAVYIDAYSHSSELDYPHLLRTWNYIHDINGVDEGLERYQSFCVARHEILEQCKQLQMPNPAATAIGSLNGHNCFVFLFGRSKGQVIENKRQVSAWQYPEQYAPKQPRFSRAMALDELLLCSGTASVVGHETVFVDDVSGQFKECMKNVELLLEAHGHGHELVAGIYRFYLREPKLADALETLVKQQGIQRYVILHGDICRENLLLECEVVFQ